MKNLLMTLTMCLFAVPALAQHHEGGGGGNRGGGESHGSEGRPSGGQQEQRAPETHQQSPRTIRQPAPQRVSAPDQHSPQHQSSPQAGRQSPNSQPNRGNNQAGHANTFKPYPTRNSPQGQPNAARSDSFGNRVTSDHQNRQGFAQNRTDHVMRNDSRIRAGVVRSTSRFNQSYHPRLEGRERFYNNYYARHEFIIRPAYAPYWHSRGFYGGFYYGFHPVADISIYFYNPLVYWFYVPTYDSYYYQTWYANDYEAYPALREPFAYHGIYYPTENLKQLLIGVSGMPVDRQVQFRAAVTEFTRKVAQNLANTTGHHVTLSTGDIVVTHYEILGYDESVVIEGSIGQGEDEYQFKGLLDLQRPKKSSVFIPSSLDADPQTVSHSSLDSINDQVKEIKSNHDNDPVEEEAPATPAELSADPEKYP